MKAYILSNRFAASKRIFPFGEPASDCLIGNKPLKEIQEKALRTAGLEPIFVKNEERIDGSEEYLVLWDNLYFSAELVREFVARSRQLRTTTDCALKKGGFTLRSAVNLQYDEFFPDHPDYVVFNLRYFPCQGNRKVSQNVIIDPDELQASIPTPEHISGVSRYAIPLTTKPLIQIEHWVHLWVANIVEALLPAARLQKSSTLKKLWLAIKARSLNQWNVLKQINSIGKGSNVHPTAIVEGSVIGRGVDIKAGAIISNSIIGDNVTIGHGVVIEESVVGEESVILHGRMIFSVMNQRTFSVGDMITASFIGRDCFIGLNSTLTDFRLDNRNVSVIIDNGTKLDSGNRFLGSCLGDGVYIGAGCVVAPGRTIPAGKRIALSQSKIVSSCKEDEDDIEGYRLIAH